MDVVVTPPIASAERHALLLALERTTMLRTQALDERGWWRAGLREAVDGDEDAGYAFSPRRTRGATRA